MCFERMGMGDLEVVDLDEGLVRLEMPPRPPPRPALQPASPRLLGEALSQQPPPIPPLPLHFCCAHWVDARDSDDEDVLGAKAETKAETKAQHSARTQTQGLVSERR